MPTYPQKENWEIIAIVVPPKSMGGKFVSCSKPKSEAKRFVFVSYSKPKIEAERGVLTERICHL